MANIFFSALNLILSAANFIFKLFCIFFGLLAGVIFILLQKIFPIAAKYFSMAIMWIISTIVTLGLIIYATSRNIFHGESINDFIKNLLPNKRISGKTDFSLLAIELIDAVYFDISSKLKMQYEKILNFLRLVQ